MDRQLNNGNLPDQDHVLRYCSSSRVKDDGKKIIASAFKMRPNEDYLSVNWMEYFCGVASDDDRVDKIRKAVGKKLGAGIDNGFRLYVFACARVG